jgi:hypothetical protein
MNHLFPRRGISFLEQVPHRHEGHARQHSAEARRFNGYGIWARQQGVKDKSAIRAGQLLTGITSRRNCDCDFGVHYNRSRGITHSSDDVRRCNLAECLLPRQKTNTETAHLECRVDCNRPQVAASAPGSLGSMVLCSLSALIPQWRNAAGGMQNTRPRYPLLTRFRPAQTSFRRRPRSTTRLDCS